MWYNNKKGGDMLKKVALIISIVLISIFCYYIYEADIEIDRSDRIEKIIWSPDNTKVAFKYSNKYKIFDKEGNLLFQVIDNKLKYKTYKWVLNDNIWNFIEVNETEQSKNKINTKSIIKGELYNPQNNPEGNLEIDKITLNFKDYLIAIDRKTGEYNIIKEIGNIEHVDIKYIDKYYALVKIKEDSKENIYFLDAEKNFKLEKLQLDKLNPIVLTQNSIEVIKNYGINNYYVIYGNMKNKTLIYKGLNSDNYYFLTTNKYFPINISNIFLADVYKNNLFLVCKSGDVYKIFSVDTARNIYTLVYKSNNLIDDIRVIDGTLYFSELNILNDISSYRLFKFDGEIKQIVFTD